MKRAFIQARALLLLTALVMPALILVPIGMLILLLVETVRDCKRNQ